MSTDHHPFTDFYTCSVTLLLTRNPTLTSTDEELKLVKQTHNNIPVFILFTMIRNYEKQQILIFDKHKISGCQKLFKL